MSRKGVLTKRVKRLTKLALLLFLISNLLAIGISTAFAWNISTIDSGGLPSIAVDANDKIHISYLSHWAGGDLKYATNASGSWTIYTIDNQATADCSLAIDSNAKIHISYKRSGGLKYATNITGLWETFAIDSSGNVGDYNSIAIDSNNKVHISYHDVGNGDLKYATNASGSWQTFVVDNSSGDTGETTWIAIDSNDKVHISYLDYGNTSLKYATNSSGSWETYTIDNSGTVGWWTSIAIDSDDKIHISYMDYGNMTLKYSNNVSGSWVAQTITGANVGPYSHTTSIAVDLHDRIHIAFFGDDDLKYATNASSTWQTSTIDTTGTVGMTNSIAVDFSGKIHISYLDYSNNYIKYASASYVVNTIPVGLQISVDGLTYNTPYIFDLDWTPSTTHTLEALSPQNGDPGTRYVYNSWSDGGDQTHTINVPSSGFIYTATFTTQYTLTTSADPPEGGTVNPPGSDWYNSDDVISISASANTGYTFIGWSGDFTGATTPVDITINGPKNVTANFESVCTPTTPSGTASGYPGVSYTFGTSGSTSSGGHNIQYFFDWGDGTNSGWLPVGTTSSSHSWASGGTYLVKAQARCAIHTSAVSAWSGTLSVSIETVSTPTTPSGPTIGSPGTNYSYSTGGSSSNFGHSLQYFFDWGDGTNSGWLPVGETSASKSWPSVGTYLVKSQARCATHTSALSIWSETLSVVIETVSTPNIPSGPTDGNPGVNYMFNTGGSISSQGDSVQYLFDWGDGTNSGWLPVGTTSASHSWVSIGTYLIKVQARCATHTSIISSWSEAVSVNISLIVPLSPADGETFNSCSLITNYQPTFSWSTTGVYTGYKIFFSTSPTDFTTTGIKVATGSATGTSNSWKPSSFNWKTIMKASNNNGSPSPIYWKVVGTKADKTTVGSEVRSFSIGMPQTVNINAPLDIAIFDPAIPPTFDFATNCNTKFKLEISSLSDFSVSTKVKGFNFTVSNPNAMSSLQKTLSSFQWTGVKKLIGTGAGYFRIKAWDGLSRPTVSEVRTFTIQ